MLKLIYKNLLAHRGRYCWIFIELCLVALIAWSVLDEVIVNTYKLNMPPGYDMDRLVTFNLNEFPTVNKEDDLEKETEITYAHLNRILDRVRSDNRVESVTFVNNNSFLAQSVSINSLDAGGEDNWGFYFTVHFWPGTDFFKTFGLKDAYADNKIYEEQSMSGRDLIVSKSVADYLFNDESAIGHFLEEKNEKYDPEKLSRIVGVVDDAVYRSTYSLTPIVYKTRKVRDIVREGGIKYIRPVIRLKPEVDVDKFIEDFSPVVAKDIRTDNIYAHSLRSFREIDKSMSRDMNNHNFIGMSIALFFFVNILLCMVGTFYLQTRKRSEETGVMRTFGASRGFIIREMLGEGFILVTIAWILGCFFYWLYIKDEGLVQMANAFSEKSSLALTRMMPTWTSDFWLHFAIVSLIIYALMLISVLIGIYIPARRISRINPVDALRDE